MYAGVSEHFRSLNAEQKRDHRKKAEKDRRARLGGKIITVIDQTIEIRKEQVTDTDHYDIPEPGSSLSKKGDKKQVGETIAEGLAFDKHIGQENLGYGDKEIRDKNSCEPAPIKIFRAEVRRFLRGIVQTETG